jgi:hypothetical protein
MKYLMQNGKGKPSKTATIYVITMVLVWIRFMVSDVTFEILGRAVEFGPLDPTLVAAMIAASGAVYGWRRHQDAQERLAGNPEGLLEELEHLAEG